MSYTFNYIVAGSALLLAQPAVTVAAADLTLWRLDCGTIRVNDLSQFSDTFDYTGETRTLTDSCYLIEHENGVFLWDTGLPAALLDAPESDEAMSPTLTRTLPDQFAEIDIKPEDIDFVGISHYHFDHIGQAADLPAATLLIGAADLAALTASPPPFGADPAALKPWIEDDGKVEAVTGDRDVFGDGTVMMLDMPGHTPGSHALLVRLANTGPVLLSGDVVHFEAQFKTGNVPGFNTSNSRPTHLEAWI